MIYCFQSLKYQTYVKMKKVLLLVDVAEGYYFLELFSEFD